MAGPSPAFHDPTESRSDQQVTWQGAPPQVGSPAASQLLPHHRVSFVAGGSQQHLLLQKAEVGGEEEPSSVLFPGDVHIRGLLVMALGHCIVQKQATSLSELDGTWRSAFPCFLLVLCSSACLCPRSLLAQGTCFRVPCCSPGTQPAQPSLRSLLCSL